jgi:hypothetical protein
MFADYCCTLARDALTMEYKRGEKKRKKKKKLDFVGVK